MASDHLRRVYKSVHYLIKSSKLQSCSTCSLNWENFLNEMEERRRMELVLAHQTKTQISVSCDGQPSHVFDLPTLILEDENDLIDDPVGYGKKLYGALFPLDTRAQRALAA